MGEETDADLAGHRDQEHGHEVQRDGEPEASRIEPRAAGRAMDDDTFEPKKALVRWILPGGLPYAITDDLEALPRDISSNVDVLARFGPAAVVKRRGAATCPER